MSLFALGKFLKTRNRVDSGERYIRSGFFTLICLTFLCLSDYPIYASPSISIENIQQMAQSSQGTIQKRYKAWIKLIDILRNKPVNLQLDKVNSFFNQFRYQSNEESRGITDSWKTPEEFVIDGGGDCKGYAIIKYFTLLYLGVPKDKLRLSYVIYLTQNQAHMVLTYYSTPEAEPLILDNLNGKILKASKRPDLKPVYSFNAEGLWLAKKRGQSSLIGKPSSLGKWDNLMKRMQQ